MTGLTGRSRSLLPFYLLILMLCLPLCAVTAESDQSLTGYYTDARYIRALPTTSSQKLENLSAFDIITVSVYDDKWYAYRLNDETTGYISRKGWKNIPEYDPCNAWQGWTKSKAKISPLPEPKAPALLNLDSETLVTIDGEFERYYHVTRTDGISGYISKASISTGTNFKVIKSKTSHYYGDEAIPLYEIPLHDAAVIEMIPSDFIFSTSATSGSFYVVEYHGKTGFVSKKAVSSLTNKTRTMICLQAEDGTPMMISRVKRDADTIPPNAVETALWHVTAAPCLLHIRDDVPAFLSPDCLGDAAGILEKGELYYAPYTAGGNRILRYEGKWISVPGDHPDLEVVHIENGEEVNMAAWVTVDETGFVPIDDARNALDIDSYVFLYTRYGDVYYASHKGKNGYILADHVAYITTDTLANRKDLSSVQIRQNPIFDASFVMLEQGNSFLTRYNAITGQNLQALFPLGIPYFWGGRDLSTVEERWPLYSTREAWQSSPNFYRKGTIYVAGLDCVGFVKEAYKQVGIQIVGDSLGNELGNQEMHNLGRHIYCKDQPMPEDWTEVASTLQIGDLILLRHPGFHVMMFIGTLRQFGYTAQQLPALADFLDYPLVIHCSGHPKYYQRFGTLIQSSSDRRIAGAAPPYGGVQISIVGVQRENAEYSITINEDTYYCFDVEGLCLTTSEFRHVNWYVVYRHPDFEAKIKSSL